MWGCFGQKKICRAVLGLADLLAVKHTSSLLEAWVDSLGKVTANSCQKLACLRGVHRPSGERYGMVFLLVMARLRDPKLQFFVKCVLPVDDDRPFQDAMPDRFPLCHVSMHGSLRPQPGASVSEDCYQ